MFRAEQWSSCELMKARIALSGSPWVRKLLTQPSKLSRKKVSTMHSFCFWNSTVAPQQITHSGLQWGQNIYTWCSTYMSEEPNMTRSVWACQTHTSVFLSLDTKSEWSCIQVKGYKLRIDLQIACRILVKEFALSNESLENGEAKRKRKEPKKNLQMIHNWKWISINWPIIRGCSNMGQTIAGGCLDTHRRVWFRLLKAPLRITLKTFSKVGIISPHNCPLKHTNIILQIMMIICSHID